MALPPRRHILFGLGLGLAALLIRLAFWRATPDAAWAYTACFKGDAPLWLDYARALRTGGLFENGLPLRPPGMAWLVAALLPDAGGGYGALRFLLCLLGAAVPVLFYAAALRRFGFGVAALAGGLMAASTGLIVLSASINNEIPYLALVGVSLIMMTGLEGRPRAVPLVAWGALQGLGCLMRVEHLLFALAGGTWLVLRPGGRGARAGSGARVASRLRATALALAGFVVALAPWHLSLWTRIHALNHAEQPLSPTLEVPFASLEGITGGLGWSPDARRAREALPGFGRRAWGDLAALHALWRGRAEVGAADFRILPELYGYAPAPLAPFPFVALYGPLNFFLAANDSAQAGFSRAGLDRSPVALERGLPAPPHLDDLFPYRDDVLPAYPRHLEALNRGYALGVGWIVAHPGRWLGLVAARARLFWEGAALGLTGYNAPYGLSGIMRRVDLVVPNRSLPATAAQLTLLGLCGLGLWRARRRPGALAPWLIFAATRLFVALVFFGYARIGSTTIPVVALLVALAFHGPGAPMPARARRPARPWLPRAAWVLLALALLVEAARFAHPPRLAVRGRAVGALDPYPAALYIDQPFHAR